MAKKKKTGGIGEQVVEPRERSDDSGHNQAEKEEHIYHPNRMIVPAHDLRGFRERVSVSMQPAHLKALADIVADPRTPFKQVQDAIRHGAVREIRYMHGILPGLKRHFLAMVNMSLEHCSRMAINESIEELFLAADKEIARLRRGGYYEEAEALISKLFAEAAGLDDSEMKREYLRMFRQRYRGEK